MLLCRATFAYITNIIIRFWLIRLKRRKDDYDLLCSQFGFEPIKLNFRRVVVKNSVDYVLLNFLILITFIFSETCLLQSVCLFNSSDHSYVSLVIKKVDSQRSMFPWGPSLSRITQLCTIYLSANLFHSVLLFLSIFPTKLNIW